MMVFTGMRGQYRAISVLVTMLAFFFGCYLMCPMAVRAFKTTSKWGGALLCLVFSAVFALWIYRYLEFSQIDDDLLSSKWTMFRPGTTIDDMLLPVFCFCFHR
jgi:hypothetical protein